MVNNFYLLIKSNIFFFTYYKSFFSILNNKKYNNSIRKYMNYFKINISFMFDSKAKLFTI